MSVYGDHTHYDTLEVDEAASQDIIDSAYQYLCHKWHPSRHPEGRSHGERKLAELSRAYRVISKPRERAEYDAWLAEQRTAGGGGKAVFGETPSALVPAQNVGKPQTELPPEADFSEVKQSELQLRAAEIDRSTGHLTSSELPEGYEYAGFWERAGAHTADWLATYLLAFLIAFPMGVFGSLLSVPRDAGGTLGGLVGLLVGVVYFVKGWTNEKMATLGKARMGLEVRTEGFERLSPGRALARYVAFTIGALLFCVTYVTQPFSRKRQCLHDFVAGTVVLRRKDANQSRLLVGVAILSALLLPLSIVGPPRDMWTRV